MTLAARRGLPHNIFDAIFHEMCKIGIVEIQDWLIKRSSWAENPTQDFLMLFVGDWLRKEGNQGSAYSVAMFIQSPVCGGQRIRAWKCTVNVRSNTDLLPA